MENPEDKDTNLEQNEDIKFDDKLSIESLQARLQSNLIASESSDEQDSEHLTEADELVSDISFNAEAFYDKPDAEKPSLPVINVSGDVKKYVVYIEHDNIDYMEQLSISERRRVINQVLTEQNKYTKEELKTKKRQNFLAHVFISIITFSIFFPILFIGINKVTKITIQNYNNSKENFSKLYKQQGKIKLN